MRALIAPIVARASPHWECLAAWLEDRAVALGTFDSLLQRVYPLLSEFEGMAVGALRAVEADENVALAVASVELLTVEIYQLVARVAELKLDARLFMVPILVSHLC